MKDFYNTWNEWKYVIYIGIIALVFIGIIIYGISQKTELAEGMVMNKWISPAYRTCDDGDCSYRSTKYIIAVQNGDDKDWWYVTENYYDSVKIGDWVKK